MDETTNIIIATPILSDAATAITGTPETAAGPASNLQTMQPTDVWEGTGGTPYLVIDLGAVSDFNLIALLATNLGTSDTMRVRTADTEGALTGGPTWDSTALTQSYVGAEGHVFIWRPAGETNRWIRIDLATASDPMYCGRLYIADAYQPSINYTYGNNEDGYADESLLDLTDGGNMIPTSGANRQVFSFALKMLTEAERHEVRELNRTRGGSSDVLVIRAPETASNKGDAIYYGLMQMRRVVVQTAFNRHETAYQLTAL